MALRQLTDQERAEFEAQTPAPTIATTPASTPVATANPAPAGMMSGPTIAGQQTQFIPIPEPAFNRSAEMILGNRSTVTDQVVNRDDGAPFRERMAIMFANTDQDRLETARDQLACWWWSVVVVVEVVVVMVQVDLKLVVLVVQCWVLLLVQAAPLPVA